MVPGTGSVCLTPGKTFQQDSSERRFLPSVAFWVAVTGKGQAVSSILYLLSLPPTHPSLALHFSPHVLWSRPSSGAGVSMVSESCLGGPPALARPGSPEPVVCSQLHIQLVTPGGKSTPGGSIYIMETSKHYKLGFC